MLTVSAINTAVQNITMQQVVEMDGLERKGSLYQCPLHDDSTASLRVYDGERGYFCFGCNSGGDVVRYWSLRTSQRDVDAARDLLRIFGITEPSNNWKPPPPHPLVKQIQRLDEVIDFCDNQHSVESYDELIKCARKTNYECLDRLIEIRPAIAEVREAVWWLARDAKKLRHDVIYWNEDSPKEINRMVAEVERLKELVAV